jgi:hypothetical protein
MSNSSNTDQTIELDGDLDTKTTIATSQMKSPLSFE